MKKIIDYILLNSDLLFKHTADNQKVALFDNKGFFLSNSAKVKYDKIKNDPHLYVAWNNSEGSLSNYYIGKSLQKGGRWKRSHAYHLGTLAHHLLDTLRYDDQNHLHWIEKWMEKDSIKKIDESLYSINLLAPVYICYIPFEVYADQEFNVLDKTMQKTINTAMEKQLTNFFCDGNIHLLNIQNNRKRG